MSYYNPFEDSSTYYNPYKQQQAAPQSLTSTLIDVAKNMAVYGGLFVLGSAAAKAASSRIGRFIKKGSFGKASSIAKKLDNPTVGSILKNTSLGREYTAYKESTGLFKASQARQAYLSKVAKEQPYRLGVARITSAFKNPTTFAATIGGIWKQNVLTGLGVSFAIDKMSGNYQAIVSEKKEWYDVPGQIGNLTKWFANESIYASAFGLLGPAAKGAASIGLVGIKKTFDGPMGKYIAKSLSQVSPGLQHINGQTRFFKDKILENARSEHDKTFLAKAIRWGQNFSTSINMNFQNLNAATRAASFGLVDAFKQQGNFGKKIGTALAPISKAIQQIREINARADKIRSERLVDTRIDLSGIRALEAAHAIAADAGISNVITKDSLDEQIMSIRESMKAKQTFLEQMLPGAKRVRNKDVVSKEWVREQVQSLRKRYDNKSAGRFMREILNMNVGENVYKIDNKIVNLNGFSPMNLLRKFISPVLDKEIRLPLTGFKFSLGEITMVDSLLTHNPRLDFFVTNDLKNKYSEFIGGITDPPMFSTNRELREEGIYTIADAMRKQESNVALFTRGGNWSFFGNKEPKTIVTGKELNYSPKSGRFRYSETNEIIIQQLLSEGYSPSEISNKLEGTGKPKTRFGRFVNKMGFGMPSKITDGIRFINNIIEGKNKGYNTAIKNIFENTDINFNIKPSLMVLDDINAHTAQILAQIIKNPKAVEIITSNKKYGNLSDLSNILNSEVHLIEKLSDPDFLKDMWKYDKNLRRDIETVKSYPSIARKHEQVKSLGGLSSMTSIDKLRVAYVDHVLNNQFLDYIDNGNGYHHPLLDAIPKLKEGNYITDKQAKALELHAKLSSLQDLSRRNITEGIANTDPNGRSLWTEMMKNEKQYGLNLHNDLLNFISENKLRRTNLNRYEQRLIQPGNNLERFINNTPYYSSGRGIAGIGQYLGASVDRLTELMGEWTPFKRDPVKHLGIFGGAKYLGGTVLKLAAVTGAYRVADSMVAANPIFEGSGLDDGITGFTADQLAKARLFSSKVGDTLGITGAMKYLNGLMPGSTSTFPGLIAGAAMANYMKASPLGMIKAMAAGAVINRIANPYLPDFSKSYEQLRKEYSGEEQVPFMKSPTWLLGSTPWEGTGVAGYQPNWYVRAKSRWESSDTLYGSEFRRLIHKPLFPLGINIGDFIDPYYMERCVTKDTKILTDQSTLVEIKDVRVGDKIHTHNNSIQTVLEKWEKEIDEDVVVLRTAFSNIPNRTTIEHRYFAVKSNTCPKRKGNRLSICFDKNWLKCKNCKYSYYRNYKSDWYRADELEKGDFLIYPRIKIKHKDCSILIHDQNKYNTKKIQKTLPKTNDLYRLFGYYLAEGHCDARSVVFDFHSDEIVYHNDVLSIFKNIFNINGTKYIDGNKTRLIFYNAILSRFFKLTFGTNCYNKTIPDNILHSNDELLKELIIGYFRGDGSDCLDSALTCVSVSENLIFQIRSILFSIGYIPAYYFDDRSARNEACGHILYVYGNNINELRRLIGFDIKKEPKEPKWYYIDDNYIYIKIKEVSFEKYSDVVVDIKVSNSHSFLGILASYHNSHYFDRPYPKCLFGSAKVVTVNGIKKIKDIDIGDYVYDINGSVTKVINVLKRKVNDNDTIFSMRVIGQEEDLILTSDHKIPIIRDKKCIFKSQHNKSCTGNDEGICRYCTKKRKDFDISWVEAKDINIGDFLVKKPINPEYLGSTIDISLYVQRPFDIKENKIFIKDKLGRYTGDSFNRYWDIDNDLAYYFGLYLSEGWLGKQRGKYISVNTVHNKKEFDHINRIINNISKKYNLKFSYKDFGTHVNFYIFDYIFSDIIYGLFNCGSATKSVKFFTKELDRKILAGLFYGDGHYDKTHVVLTSINMNLINFATIVLENDFISTCLKKHCDNGHQSYRLSFSYSYLDDYRLLFDINHKNENILTSNKKLHLIYFRNGYLLKRIIKKEEIEYNDFLYDLTVESPTHSFSLYEFIVHNSGRLFSEVPIIGEMLAPIGRILKPEKTMHQEFLQGEWAGTTDGTNPSLASVPPPTYQQNMIMMNKGNGARSMGNVSFNGGNYTIGTVTPWSKVIQGRLAGNVEDALGLTGFMTKTSLETIFGKPTVMPTLETAGRMASMSRSFYDLNLGGMGVLTEPIRRLITKPEANELRSNPIPNMFPNWLPSQFLSGDAYSKIMKGELRLPGQAYLKTNPDTKMSMPARSSMWGAPLEDIVKYFTGSLPPLLKEEYDILEEGTLFHNKIQDSLAAENLLIQAEAKVYDVINDISGHVDAIIRDGKGGKGRRGLEIKSISDKGFQKLDAPKSNHVSQLNFYLHQLRFNNGTILYINRDNPSQVKTFELQYDKNRWERDVEKLKRGRQIARDMLKENVGDTIGYSYSWLDRLKILADVAPASNEYHEAKEIVMQQIKAGQFTQNEIDKFHTVLKHRQTRLRKYELYPIRFKGKIMSPDTESNIQSINEDIKSGESYSLQERVIGAAWETFTNSNNALVNKFWAKKDPLEHYKELRLYGKEYKPWDEPYSSFIEPFTRTALSKTNPIGGSISWGAGGYTIGGEFGALVGSVLGATYSTVNGLFRGLSNSVYVPDSVKEQRNLNTYFDKLKYERNNMMASLSQGITRDEFISARSATLESFNRESDPSIGNLFRATGNDEKPYIEAWINTTDPDERNNILNIVPPDLATALKRVWSRNDGKSFTKKRIQSISEDMGRQFYNFDQSVMDPRIELDDIKLKTIEDKGFEAHDFGLGWNEQLLRIKESQYEIPSANISEAVTFTPNLSSSQIRQQLYSLFNQLGIRGTANVYINNMDGPNVVNLTIRRDRSLAVINALRNRKQYGLE